MTGKRWGQLAIVGALLAVATLASASSAASAAQLEPTAVDAPPSWPVLAQPLPSTLPPPIAPAAENVPSTNATLEEHGPVSGDEDAPEPSVLDPSPEADEGPPAAPALDPPALPGAPDVGLPAPDPLGASGTAPDAEQTAGPASDEETPRSSRNGLAAIFVGVTGLASLTYALSRGGAGIASSRKRPPTRKR